MGGPPIRNGIGALMEARSVVIKTGRMDNVAEKILALCREYDRETYQRTHASRLAYSQNRPRNKAVKRASYLKHRDSALAKAATYRAEHREEIRAYLKAYRATKRRAKDE